jgi:subtilisin family serine protease
MLTLPMFYHWLLYFAKDIGVKVEDISVFDDDDDDTQMKSVQQGLDISNGLDRIDQVSLPLNKVYNYTRTGKNVTVYILDTGVLMDHIDLQGKATCGLDLFADNSSSELKYCNDTFNHGTAVAAVIGGYMSGVAKGTKLVSVKVISSSTSTGTTSAVLAGLEYVRLQKKAFPRRPMVINMSLGSIYSKSVNRAVDGLVDAGVAVVAAAGNRGVSACLASPASSKRVISVGASTTNSFFFKERDHRAVFSNWGRCVDIFAYVSLCL